MPPSRSWPNASLPWLMEVSADPSLGRAPSETTTIGELFAGIFGQDRSAIAARVNGELRDLSRPVADGDEIEPVKAGSDDGSRFRRSVR